MMLWHTRYIRVRNKEFLLISLSSWYPRYIIVFSSFFRPKPLTLIVSVVEEPVISVSGFLGHLNSLIKNDGY